MDNPLMKEVERLKEENNKLKGIASVERVKRTSKGLKEVLFTQLDELLGDNPDYKKANTISKMVKTIVDVGKTELDYAKYNREIHKEEDDYVSSVKTIQMR
jgi:uncharacterized protein related to proFAR isomerase